MILERRPGWGKGQNSTLSEYGHVAYQIKGNDACSNMEANILPADPPADPRVGGSKGKNSTFLEHGHVEYQIKWNHKWNNMVANISDADSPPPPPPEPRDGAKAKIQLFQNMVMLHIKLKEMTHAATW